MIFPPTSSCMFSLKSSPMCMCCWKANMCCWKANTSKKLETVFIIAFPIQLQHDSQPSAPSVPFPISSVWALNGLLELRKTETLSEKYPLFPIPSAGGQAEKEIQSSVHFDTTRVSLCTICTVFLASHTWQVIVNGEPGSPARNNLHMMSNIL